MLDEVDELQIDCDEYDDDETDDAENMQGITVLNIIDDDEVHYDVDVNEYLYFVIRQLVDLM